MAGAKKVFSFLLVTCLLALMFLDTADSAPDPHYWRGPPRPSYVAPSPYYNQGYPRPYGGAPGPQYNGGIVTPPKNSRKGIGSGLRPHFDDRIYDGLDADGFFPG